MDLGEVAGAVEELTAEFSADRHERQQRRELRREDFERLAQAGLLMTGVPEELGGLWRSVAESTRPICEIYRTLAGGDSSVALSNAMHPAVLSFWLATPEVPEPHANGWADQRDQVFKAAASGHWWGTITSEPGSGGDVAKTRAAAEKTEDGWRLSGQKHFGSGSGITSFMLTAAVPQGEMEPDWFYIPLEGEPFDGSTGIRLVAPWDGHGMQATQSHGLEFIDHPAVRFAWPGHREDLAQAAGPFVGCLFTAVILGILDTAVETAREKLSGKAASLRPYEQVEWAQAELEAWTAQQVFEGMLRAVEQTEAPLPAALRGKTMIAQLAESALLRICRVLGGATFSRNSPFGHWFEDVRALGFLRPSWGLATDALIAQALPDEI